MSWVYKDKPSGLVVDYLGVAEQLKKAVGVYAGHGDAPPGVPVEQALALLEESVDVVRGHPMSQLIPRLAQMSGIWVR